KLKGNQLLREIIRQDHSNPEALSLLAFSYFEGEDYKMAAVTWAMMLRLLEPDDPRVPMLEKSIRAARDALALQEEEKAKSVTPEK
ncbi:MAG: c-type cytochrome biogenesis protein CcmI, partial [Haemophilus parainfluenzae]|nr:c-type cytochrome biogenesis protein CcmI [Haemophilus parainfluenzae]MBF1229257.1 c-type cytochrome biogenesis protein CcmI [Haemophilus parainfluenzae]